MKTFETIRNLNKRIIRKGGKILKKLTKSKTDLERKLARMTPDERRDFFIREFVPSRARLDVSTICQLRCAGCGFQRGGADNLERGFLTLENFKRFCEMNPFIKEIEISNYGEPFLNPDLVDIRYNNNSFVQNRDKERPWPILMLLTVQEIR